MTDAAVLAVRSDGVLLIVRIDSTTTTQVQRSVAALDLVGAPVLGVVASMTSPRGLPSYGSEEPTSTSASSTDNEWPVPNGQELRDSARESTKAARRRDKPDGRTVA